MYIVYYVTIITFSDFTITIAYDVVKSRDENAFSDHSDQVSRRMGFIPIPLSVLLIRILTQSLCFSSRQGFILLGTNGYFCNFFTDNIKFLIYFKKYVNVSFCCCFGLAWAYATDHNVYRIFSWQHLYIIYFIDSTLPTPMKFYEKCYQLRIVMEYLVSFDFKHFILALAWVALVTLKILNSIILLGKACNYIAQYERMQQQTELLQRMRNRKSKSVPASPRMSLIDFSGTAIFNQSL